MSDDLSDDVAGIADLGACEVTEVEVVDNAPEESREEVRRLAEQVRRHVADRELFEAVLAEKFGGRAWWQLGDDLLKYGLAVVDAWLRTGYIFMKTAQVGRPMFPSSYELSELKIDKDLRDGLSDVVVAVALTRFQEQALAGTGWKHDGGTSLTTYFVGGCVLAFSNEFHRWRRHERRWGVNRSTAPEDLADYHDGSNLVDVERSPLLFDDPQRSAAERDYLCRVLDELKDAERVIVEMTAVGYAQEEIGEVLGVTERGVEGRLYRLRQRDIRSHVEGSRDDG